MSGVCGIFRNNADQLGSLAFVVLDREAKNLRDTDSCKFLNVRERGNLFISTNHLGPVLLMEPLYRISTQ